MNSSILQKLHLLHLYYENTNDVFRANAYNRAIGSITNLGKQINNISDINELTLIGSNIRAKIKEFLDTGEIVKVNEIISIVESDTHTTSETNIKNKLKNIWGVGESKANNLWNNGVRSINMLQKQPDLLNSQQKIGLQYYEELLKPVQRHDINQFYTNVKQCLDNVYNSSNYDIEVAGSYRRGSPTSKDIDILLSSEKFNLHQVVKLLQNCGLILDTLCMKDEKFMGVVKINDQVVRLDIVYVKKKYWGSALLYFTGNKTFNIVLRDHAKKKGYTLNQYGLFYNNERIPAFTEKEIFEELRLVYVEPILRF